MVGIHRPGMPILLGWTAFVGDDLSSSDFEPTVLDNVKPEHFLGSWAHYTAEFCNSCKYSDPLLSNGKATLTDRIWEDPEDIGLKNGLQSGNTIRAPLTQRTVSPTAPGGRGKKGKENVITGESGWGSIRSKSMSSTSSNLYELSDGDEELPRSLPNTEISKKQKQR